jgi:sugar (pentulose or hexulose) kinase
VLALIGGAPPLPGQAMCSLGSSSMVFAPLPPDHAVADPANRLYVYPLLPYPLLGGVSSTTGAALQWAWESLYGDHTPIEDAIRQAVAVPAGAQGLFFLPFLAGERSPFWNDGLRGGFYGLTLAHRRPHLLRAVLEGVAFSLRFLLDLYAELGVRLDAIALAGGGSATPGWPQIIADVCHLPVRIYTGAETVTRGLYAFACQSLGGESFVQALARTFPAPVVLSPRPDGQVYDEIYRRYCLLADFAHHTLSAGPQTSPGRTDFHFQGVELP